MTLSRFVFELTTRCNLNCKHCIRDRNDKPIDLDPSVLEKVLKEGKEIYGVGSAAFTGGEPLMYPHLDRLFELANQYDYGISFVSNGFFVPKWIKKLASPEVKPRLRNFCVSLDGPDLETHDAIRGDGAYKKAMAAITLLKASGITVVIKYSIGRHNFENLERTLLDFAYLKADRVELAHTHPTPDNLRAGLVLDPEECRKVESIVYRAAEELKIPITLSAGVYSPQRFYSCCSLDMSDLYVDAKGRLCLCCMLPGIRGRDRDKDETDVVADLAETNLITAHKKLLSLITGIKRKRLERMEKGDLTETDHFQCIACARHFGKLEWLDEFKDNPWAEPGREREGTDK